MTATLRTATDEPSAIDRQRDEDHDSPGSDIRKADQEREVEARHARPADTSVEHVGGDGNSGSSPGLATPTHSDLPTPIRPHGKRDSADGHAPQRSMPMTAGPSLVGAFVDVLPVLPTIGAIATVFAYIGVGDAMGITGTLHLWPLATGAAAAIGAGVLLAFCIRPYFTAPDQAHPQSFAELRQRLDSLTSQIRMLSRSNLDDLTPSQQLALADATAHQLALERELARGGPHWLIGTGYLDALTRLHRAEEALILVQPDEDLIAGALFDELRLNGSTIPERDRLLGNVQAAVQVLAPGAAAYMTSSVAGHRGPSAEAHRARPGDNRTPAGQRTDDVALQSAHARMVLQGVRRSINEFRDESRARLIRSRARLFGTMTVTGLITYVLLAFAVAVSPNGRNFSNDPIAAAAAIYLVGAVVGLFNRLYMESGDEAAGEDYGLSKTRLLLTPMLSGLAAVGGVMIVGMLSGVVDVNAFTPAPVLTPTLTPITGIEGMTGSELPRGAAAEDPMLSLADVFNLERYPFGLVLAAVFGLAPKSFLERIHKAGEQSKLDLKSTAATR